MGKFAIKKITEISEGDSVIFHGGEFKVLGSAILCESSTREMRGREVYKIPVECLSTGKNDKNLAEILERIYKLTGFETKTFKVK